MKKQSLFFKFFIALTLFIAVPVVVIASILSYQIVKYSEEEISKSAIGKLKAAEKVNELIAENMSQRALEMTIGTTMNDLSGITKYTDIFSNPEGIMRIYDLQNELIDLANVSTSLHSVYLYIDDTDFIFTSNQAVLSMNDFADTGWMPSYNSFKNTKSGSNWMSTRTIRLSKENAAGELGASNKVITFFYTFTPYTTNVKGVLVFNIYEESIRKLVNNSDSLNDGYIEIVNTNGDVISHIRDDMVGRNISDDTFIKAIEDSPSAEGHMNNYIDNKRQLITYYKSDYNNWIYIGVFPVDSLMAKVNKLKTYTMYICLIFILAGILVSYFISKKIYSPLRKLLQDIRLKKGIDMKSNESEMSILSKVYDSLLKEEARLFFLLEHKDNIRDTYLMSLIKGKNEEDFDKELTGIDFTYPNYVCAIIVIDRHHLFEKGYSKEQQEYMRILILKVSEELINSVYECAGLVYDKKKIALVINFGETPEEVLKQSLKKLFVQIQDEMRKIFDNTISIGIGSWRESAAGIGDSLDEAQEALRYKLTEGCGSINFWQDIEYESSTYYYPFVHEKYIFNILNVGNKGKLEEVISEMVREIRDNREVHYDNIIQIFNQLIGNTIKYLLDAHCNISMIFGSGYNIYHALSTKETLEDIKVWLVEIYSTIADYLLESRSRSKSYFEQALDYIHKNYKRDIDIKVIAEHAGISYSHLRKIFKEETGENIVNYINNLRINESKRLLCMPNMTIKEIALILGYNNDQSFVRFFKKYEGIAPGEFRISNKIPESGIKDSPVQSNNRLA
jgi:AraC-like DNA-binding protein